MANIKQDHEVQGWEITNATGSIADWSFTGTRADALAEARKLADERGQRFFVCRWGEKDADRIDSVDPGQEVL